MLPSLRNRIFRTIKRIVSTKIRPTFVRFQQYRQGFNYRRFFNSKYIYCFPIGGYLDSPPDNNRKRFGINNKTVVDKNIDISKIEDKSIVKKGLDEYTSLWEKEYDCKLFVIDSEIDHNLVLHIKQCLARLNSYYPIDIILHTRGGSTSCAKEIVELFQGHKVRIFVPYYAYSAGSQLALYANELFMSPIAHLSPFDVIINGYAEGDLKTMISELNKKTIGIRGDAGLVTSTRESLILNKVNREMFDFNLKSKYEPSVFTKIRERFLGINSKNEELYHSHNNSISYQECRQLGVKMYNSFISDNSDIFKSVYDIMDLKLRLGELSKK
jgi:hypothetical protein